MDRPTFPEMKGTPHVTAAPQKRLSATAVLAGVTGGLDEPQAGQPPSGPPACAFLPPPMRSLRGRPARGTWGAEGSWEPALSPLSPWKWGFSAKALASVSWTAEVRPFLFGESWSEVRFEVLESSKAPLDTPSLMCPSPHAPLWAWPVDGGAWEGRAPGTPPPTREGSVTPALSPAGRALRAAPCARHGPTSRFLS